MHFLVFTDHRPLLHLQTAKLGAVEQRWAGQLACYDFELRHKPGLENRNADALSRQSDPVAVAQATVHGIDWEQTQGRDPVLAELRQWKLAGVEPAEEADLPGPSLGLLKEWEQLEVQQGVLVQRQAGGQGVRVVVPQSERQQLWKEFHEALGHARGRRMARALQHHFFWPGLRRDVESWQKSCPQCLVGSVGPSEWPPLQGIKTSYPWEILAVDFLWLGRPADPKPYVLVVIDLFSRYAFAVPTRDQTAETAARVLWREVFQRYGCPERLLSDRGPAFESELFQHLCTMYGCTKIRTTPYRPQGNGACERWNQTLLGLLNTLAPVAQQRWTEALPDLVQAYNSIPHESTGLTPFFVLFGRHPRLPVEQKWGGVGEESPSGMAWLKEHRRRLQSAMDVVQQQSQSRQEQDRCRTDQRLKAVPLLPGERVLVRNFRRRGRGKLGPYWGPLPQVVVRRPDPQGPVYQVRPEGAGGPVRTIHRRHLRVCPPGCGLQPPETVGGRRGVGVSLEEGGGLLGWPGNQLGAASSTPDIVAPEVAPEPGLEDGDSGDPGPELDGEVGEPAALRRSHRANLGVRPARYRP